MVVLVIVKEIWNSWPAFASPCGRISRYCSVTAPFAASVASGIPSTFQDHKYTTSGLKPTDVPSTRACTGRMYEFKNGIRERNSWP